jgi:hypothetical protein
MQIDQSGAPVIATTDDQIRLDTFIADLADAIYGRLPWLVKRFLSVTALERLLHLGADELAKKAGAG